MTPDAPLEAQSLNPEAIETVVESLVPVPIEAKTLAPEPIHAIPLTPDAPTARGDEDP